MGIGMGEGLIIGLICCMIGGGAAFAFGLVLLAVRKGKKPEE